MAMKTIIRSLLSMAGISIFLSACTTDQVAPYEDVEPAGQGDTSDQVFTETAVFTNEDGTQTIRQRSVTLTEQIRRREYEAQVADARAKGIAVPQTMAMGIDLLCGTKSLIFFDAPNFVGNSICFMGFGGVDLSVWGSHFVCGTSYVQKVYDYTWTSDPVLGCVSSGVQENKVRSMRAGETFGAFTRTGAYCHYDRTNRCLNWTANQSLANINPGTCGRYAFRGPPSLSC